MMDVVDSDELLRRIQRARTCAQEEVRAWRARGADLADADADGAGDARTRGIAYEAVLRVLDEIVTPGRSPEGI
ncbi:hypothetical protein QFZ56_000593 [Streptomyces achromogenes]|uniref:Uncharacterized protein n=1 Tax=Streptomyces achromogenes TaxID=67255 RepID=A0ABU0PVD5_STRAH|nr:hypothetical protein [Streptomyces achromogenes]MDQ0681630.1 hypothetical protein [Streptomyces achromogenes]